MKSELSQGYKVTPLGIIPKEWEIYDFDKIVMRPQSRHLPNPQIHLRCIELEHLSQGGGSILGYIDSAEQKSMKNEFDEGDVLFGKLRPYLRKYWLAKFGGVCSTEIWVFRVMSDICTKEYLFNIVSSYNFIQKANVSSGSKMPRAEWGYVSKIPILTPPLAEQEKIAEILSTWDKAIEKQTQLIQKLELRKKGLMQQLLTGKKRLPGFTDEWKKVKLGEISKRVTRKNDTNCQNVVTISAQKGFVRQTDFFNKIVASKTTEQYYLVKRDEFCYNKSYSNGFPMGAIKRLVEFEEAVVTTLYICFVIESDIASIDFIEQYFSLGLLNNGLRKVANEGGRAHGLLNVTPYDFFDLKMFLPSLQEQTAIANILSSCDEETRLAQDKLVAMREQKKGLMQVLLTGKKRVTL